MYLVDHTLILMIESSSAAVYCMLVALGVKPCPSAGMSIEEVRQLSITMPDILHIFVQPEALDPHKITDPITMHYITRQTIWAP